MKELPVKTPNSIYDPKVCKDQIDKDLNYGENINQINKKFIPKDTKSWTFFDNIYDAAHGTDAIILLTDWQEFYKLNFQKLYNLMRSPCWIFDTRNVIDPSYVKSFGFKVWKLGDGSLN